MRIALVSSGSGSRGGGEIYLRFLAKGLSDAGHEVLALVPELSRMDALASSLEQFASVCRFAFVPTYDRRLRTVGALLDKRQRKRLTAQMAALPVDIIHVNQQVAEDGLDLVLAAKESGKPWLSTIHVGHSASALGARLGFLRDKMTERTLRRSDGHFIAVSATSANQLTKRIDQHVHIALNGVQVPEASALAEARRRARSEWSVQEGDIVIGCVGRIEAQKAPLALIDHVAPFAHSHGNVHVVWIGDGSMRSVLQDHAAQHAGGMPLFVDGWRSDAALRLAGLDIFALPSVFEGLPLALLEAMHAGLPIVASRADGIAEALAEGKSGFLCKNPQDWNDAISALLNDPILRSRIGTAAKQDAGDRFSTTSMASQTARIYREVLNAHGNTE